MKRIIFLLVIALFGAGGYLYAQCNMPMNEEQTTDPGVLVNALPAESPDPAQKVERILVGNTICPVSGDPIPSGTVIQYEHKGRIYNFCCPMCIELFKQDPEKYIKNLEEKEKAAAEAASAADTGKK